MRKLFFCLCLFQTLMIYSQSPPCASDAVHSKLVGQYPEMGIKMDNLNAAIRENYPGGIKKGVTDAPPSPESILIPIVFYVIHDNTPATNLPDSQVMAQLNALNQKFYDTGIKFCLASKAGTGSQVPMNQSYIQTQATPGIIHLQNTALTSHVTANNYNPLLDVVHADVRGDRYVRVFIVKTIDGPSSPILGYAYFPNGSSYFDGIVIRSNVCGNGQASLLANYNQGETLVHEMGHYLGLYHTFYFGCATSNNNCNEDGDMVCDTPAVAAANMGCVTNTNSCPEIPASYDDVTNYMDYGTNVCTNHFTAGQKARMLYMLNLYRSYLISTNNLLYTGGTCGLTNLLSAQITTSTYNICQGGTVNFSALSASGYSWNFGDVASGASNVSTIQAPSHTFNSAVNSPYTVSLTVTNSGGATMTSTILVYVTNCASVAPGSDSYWYTGTSNGLNFASGVPVFDTSFPQTVPFTNRVASVADASGNLLFYTNGINVWNKFHQLINTGGTIGVNGSSWFYGTPLIVPMPGNSSQYYILTSGYDVYSNINSSSIGFEYSIVNIVGGLATSVTQIRQPVTAPTGYLAGFNNTGTGATGFTAIKRCNDEYWILTTQYKNNNTYLVTYRLSATGISYVTGSEALIPSQTGISPLTYRLESSKDGNRVFVFGPYFSSYLYDFDKSTGITNRRQPIKFANSNVLSASFSPNSKLLYCAVQDVVADQAIRIYQCNVNSPVPNNNKIGVGFESNVWILNYSFDMQAGPDNKIYFTQGNEESNTSPNPRLGVISAPDNLCTAANFNRCQYSLFGPQRPNIAAGNYLTQKLPNLIDAKQETAYFVANTPKVISYYPVGCNIYKFFPNYANPTCGITFRWTLTNNTTGTTTNTTTANPTFNLSVNGTYTITVRNNANNALLGTTSITTSGSTPPIIEGSTSACVTSNSITNNTTVLLPGQTAVWTATGGTINGSTTSESVAVNWTTLPGTLTLTVTNSLGCSATTTRTIGSVCDCSCITNASYSVSPMEFGSALSFEYYHNSVEACDDVISAYWNYGDGSQPTQQTVHQFPATGTYTVTLTLYLANGCTRTIVSQVQAGGPTGGGPGNGNGRISGLAGLNTTVKVTPNPSKGVFNIRIDAYSGKVNIEIHDANGKLVFLARQEEFNIEKEIDLSRFGIGTYFLKVTGENLDYSQKLIKN